MPAAWKNAEGTRVHQTPSPYLRGEGKQQQQRAGRSRHRTQSIFLQSQNVGEAPLTGDPQPGQHLQKGRPKTGTCWREGPPHEPPPHSISPGAMTQHKAWPHAARTKRGYQTSRHRAVPRPRELGRAPDSTPRTPKSGLVGISHAEGGGSQRSGYPDRAQDATRSRVKPLELGRVTLLGWGEK